MLEILIPKISMVIQVIGKISSSSRRLPDKIPTFFSFFWIELWFHGVFLKKVLFFFVFEVYVSYIYIFQSLLIPFVILNIFCLRRPLSQNHPSSWSIPNQVALLVVLFLDCFIYIYFSNPPPNPFFGTQWLPLSLLGKCY